MKYLIGGYEFSANDIEHGVLRANAANPAALASLLGKPQWAPRTFKEKDPRAALSVSPVDPRIHFALVRHIQFQVGAIPLGVQIELGSKP